MNAGNGPNGVKRFGSGKLYAMQKEGGDIDPIVKSRIHQVLAAPDGF